jgi:hypothetical protein
LENFLTYFLYKRFIDDVFEIWIPDPDPAIDWFKWAAFKTAMNKDTGLTWEFSQLCQLVAFMDLTISIQNCKIHTTLYEKALNLYLYIPPHSAHPPGMIKGIILGSLYRFYNLCSDPMDTADIIRKFYARLLARGYSADTIVPIFEQGHRAAIKRQLQTTLPKPVNPTFAERVFFHIRYHPYDPRSFVIQKTWKEELFHPRWRRALTILKNNEGKPIKLNQLTVAYSRPFNIGNILSYRKIGQRYGPPVSSFRITNA